MSSRNANTHTPEYRNTSAAEVANSETPLKCIKVRFHTFMTTSSSQLTELKIEIAGLDLIKKHMSHDNKRIRNYKRDMSSGAGSWLDPWTIKRWRNVIHNELAARVILRFWGRWSLGYYRSPGWDTAITSHAIPSDSRPSCNNYYYEVNISFSR